MLIDKSKTGLEILQSAVLIGILGDVLLRSTPWGLNAALFVTGLIAAYVMIASRRRPEFLTFQNRALAGAAVFFGACFAWRDSFELKFANFVAILAILAVATLPAIGVKNAAAGVVHFAAGAFWSLTNAMIAPLVLVFGDIRWKELQSDGWRRNLVAVLRGLAIAAPLVFIFGALFVAADAVFENIIERTLNIRADIIISHVFLTSFLSWIVAGYLRGSLVGGFGPQKPSAVPAEPAAPPSVTDPHTDEPPSAPVKPATGGWPEIDNSFLPRTLTVGAVEIGIVLGLTNLLFLSFVIVQLPYLFGGFDLVQQTENLKLATYARRGFGELVIVAGLVLPLLLGAHWLIRSDSPAAEKLFRVLAAIKIVLLFVIMASAAQRLLILTGNLGYGLTTVRFYPMVAMVWLAIVFVWFAATVLRGSRQRFAWGAFWSALVVLGALQFFNPDRYIVATNFALMKQGREFDVRYNTNLSDDSLTFVIENLDQFPAEMQNTVKASIRHRYCRKLRENDFRSWNLSRWQAGRGFESLAGWAESVDCPKPNWSRLSDD